ncbi:hypothetical protein KR084_010248, partial [Drosophila pseudotakahashii]
MVTSAAELALNQFIDVSDRLSELESRINIPSAVPPTLSVLNIRRDEIREVWVRIKKEYDACTACLVAAGESTADSLPVLKAKYGYCYSAYERCGAQIADQIAQTPQIPQSTSTPADPPQTYIPSGCHLPPCDTEVFTGDYLRWPTFRDLFTAIYINNPRLTPVEKLFHLNAKTRGDAHKIVSNSPLTNDGFRSANEQRLKRDSTLKSKYDSVIQEYLDLNHMREVLPTHDSACYYLPHHAVLKPESTTTKLRVVFNASSPSDNGVSLNDILHAGPVLQSDLTIQILK